MSFGDSTLSLFTSTMRFYILNDELQSLIIELQRLNDALRKSSLNFRASTLKLYSLNDEVRSLIVEVKRLNVQAKSLKSYALSMNFDLLRRKIVDWRASWRPAEKKEATLQQVKLLQFFYLLFRERVAAEVRFALASRHTCNRNRRLRRVVAVPVSFHL
jgi:hypothetical protein